MKWLTGYKKFKNLSEWIILDGYCLVRTIKGGDINNIEDGVAFIERTPRVRASNICAEHEDGYVWTKEEDKKYWIYGSKGSCYTKEDKEDINSVMWCDTMLELLGWEVE